jgi:hypothetical protein
MGPLSTTSSPPWQLSRYSVMGGEAAGPSTRARRPRWGGGRPEPGAAVGRQGPALAVGCKGFNW